MLAELVRRRADAQCPFFSLEFSPPRVPKTAPPNGLELEMEKFDGMIGQLKEAGPLFVDITWFLRNDPGNLQIPNSSTSIAIRTQQLHALPTMLHMTCNGYSKAQTLRHVRQAAQNGVESVLALRGDDPPPGAAFNPANEHFAADMVGWVREAERPASAKAKVADAAGGGVEKPLSRMTVAVAGNPIAHPLARNYAEHLQHLKRKVEAGADFIVTQFFFEAEVFESFVADCRRIGITVPILPGILLFRNANSVINIAKLSAVPIPPRIFMTLHRLRDNAAAVRNFALHLSFDICRRLLSNGTAPGIHVFTMNNADSTGMLLRRLGMWQRCDVFAYRLVNGRCAEDCDIEWEWRNWRKEAVGCCCRPMLRPKSG